ncbi:hypothetical protein FRAHR75_510004 [Frankia sp. Hr75.2]|nr:hypothetical protein FRAHR75_510004 [Frankia sp. Hr75.2]
MKPLQAVLKGPNETAIASRNIIGVLRTVCV